MLNIVNEIEKLVGQDENLGTIEDLKKHKLDKIKKLEEALKVFMSENDLKLLKTEFLEKWKYLSIKLADLYEYFNSINENQKLVNNLQKEDFFSKLKNKCPSDKVKERTKEINNLFNIKNGEELKKLYLKIDVILITCVF